MRFSFKKLLSTGHCHTHMARNVLSDTSRFEYDVSFLNFTTQGRRSSSFLQPAISPVLSFVAPDVTLHWMDLPYFLLWLSHCKFVRVDWCHPWSDSIHLLETRTFIVIHLHQVINSISHLLVEVGRSMNWSHLWITCTYSDRSASSPSPRHSSSPRHLPFGRDPHFLVECHDLRLCPVAFGSIFTLVLAEEIKSTKLCWCVHILWFPLRLNEQETPTNSYVCCMFFFQRNMILAKMP